MKIRPSLVLLGLTTILTRADIEDRVYLERGMADEFAAVVMVMADSGRVVGTGSLIGSRLVLTAAHVARELRTSSLRVVVGVDTIAVADTLIHPGAHDSLGATNRLDVAILRLTRSATLQNLASLARLSTRPPRVGDSVALVGFGVGGPGASAAGRKRFAENVLDAIGVAPDRPVPPFALLMDFDSPKRPDLNVLGAPHPLPLEGIQSGGDSGGPVLRRAAGGWEIVGVYYRTGYRFGGLLQEPKEFGGTVSQSVSIEAFREWLAAIQSGASPQGEQQ